jgi:hypothetical protein
VDRSAPARAHTDPIVSRADLAVGRSLRMTGTTISDVPAISSAAPAASRAVAYSISSGFRAATSATPASRGSRATVWPTPPR